SPQLRKRGCSTASEAPPPPGLLRSSRLPPCVASRPSRWRNSDPRSNMDRPDARSELTALGTGLGDGLGVGVGRADCAAHGAGAKAKPSAPTSSIAPHASMQDG